MAEAQVALLGGQLRVDGLGVDVVKVGLAQLHADAGVEAETVA